MKKISLKYWWILCAIFLYTGCYDEDALSPSNDPEDLVSLPQGDHDYDDIIMDWFDKYGFTAMYIFEDTDIYWGNESWLQGDHEIVDIRGGTEIGKPGDEVYVGDLCDMFDKLFLSHYPDNLLMEGMPLRIFLCSSLFNYEYGGWDVGYIKKKIWIYEGWDNIAVNGASSYIRDSLTRQDQLDFSHDLNSYFLVKAAEFGLLSIPEEFYEESKYDAKESLYGLKLFENGYLKQEESAVRQSKKEYMKADLQAHLNLLSYSLDYLENGKLEEIDSYDAEPSLSGIFKRPEAAKIKKKYEILVKTLKDTGIKIGDIQNPPMVEY